MPFDRNQIQKGLFLRGGEYPGIMKTPIDRTRIVKGMTMVGCNFITKSGPPPKPDYSTIESRIKAARKKLDEIRGAIK